MFALGIRYLTGYAVATDVATRDGAEWPPHPARVFMALAAAMFETGEDPEERTALMWLEKLGPPHINVSEADERAIVTNYVPVNDNGAPLKGNKPLTPLQSVALGRDRQPRTFPRIRPHRDTLYLLWPNTSPEPQHVAALQRVCRNVTRIGHSSSLVQMWLEAEPPRANWVPRETGSLKMRYVSCGTLDYLATVYNRDAIELFASLTQQIESAKGKEKKQLKQEVVERFGQQPPASLRPAITTWQAYAPVDQKLGGPDAVLGVFDPELIVFELQDGPVVGLESAWQLTTSLHKTILKICDPAPEWVSGHTRDGKPSASPHLAVLPLAFVGSQYADGHLMGLALAIPRNIAADDWGTALAPLLFDENGELKEHTLHGGRLGEWRLVQESRPSPPRALRSETWTNRSNLWASVTPIVLDRHPKTERAKDRQAWSLEVAEIIAESCERQGLPRPCAIDIDKTSWHRGAPRAVGGKSAGFPLMPVKEGQTRRQQVHAWIAFDVPVAGPLILGAGRYRGYGLCRPLKRKQP